MESFQTNPIGTMNGQRPLPSVMPLQTRILTPLEIAREGQILFWSGDAGCDVFQVVKGVVRFSSVTRDGRRMISGFALAGEFFSLSDAGRYVNSAEAASECLYRRLPRHTLDPARRSIERDFDILGHIEHEPWSMQAEIMQLLHRSADESVAYFLYSVGRRSNRTFRNGSEIRLEMSRVDIADHLGLTVETVCRSIKRLAREEVIAARDPHHFIAVDCAKLRGKAGEGTGVEFP